MAVLVTPVVSHRGTRIGVTCEIRKAAAVEALGEARYEKLALRGQALSAEKRGCR